MSLPLYTVDAFTKTPFSGNQAGVCLVGDNRLPETTMQSLAAEMNISETSYLEFVESGSKSFKHDNQFKLRWFTPKTEVPLCGHATLASAAVLFFECGNINDEITFSTKSGDLKAKRHNNDITLDFPKNKPSEVDFKEFEPVIKAVLGDSSSDVEKVLLSTTARKLLLVLQEKHSSDRLKSVSPDFEKMLTAHDGSRAKGVIVTTKGTEGYDFFSRYFAPWVGIPEDPVTGSAHTVLGPYWSDAIKKETLKAKQCSDRGGDLHVMVNDQRVHISGSAVTVVRGTVALS